MACNSSSQGFESTKTQDSKEELCVTSLIHGPQIQQNSSTSTDPKSSTQPDASAGEAPFRIEMVPKSFGFLFLARELRDIIYSDLITSGDVAILVVSQQLHDEAKEILLKQGIFRVYLNTPLSEQSHNPWRPSVLAVSNRIQIFNILMYMPPSMLNIPGRFCSSKYDKLTLKHMQSRRDSRHCNLTLIVGISIFSSGNVQNRILELASTFSSFELVALRIHSTTDGLPRRCWKIPESVHTKTLQWLASSLQLALGCPEWKADTNPSSLYQTSTYARARPNVIPFCNAQYLEFHPRKRNGRAQMGSTIGDSSVLHHLEDTAGVRNETAL